MQTIKLLIAGLFLVVGSAAHAADAYDSMKDRSSNLPSIERVEPAKNFAGAYVGVSLSWDRMDVDQSGSLIHNPVEGEGQAELPNQTIVSGSLGSSSDDSFGYGVVAGYNWQIGRIYFGPQLTLEGSDLSTSVDVGDQYFGGSVEVRNTWRAGFMGKLGVQVFERVGLYGKAGYMIGGFEVEGKGNAYTTPLAFSHDGSAGGFAFGGGVDVKLADNWTLSADYTRWNVDGVDTSGNLIDCVDFTHTADPTIDIAKLTLTYTFN